ncbi:1,2-phenylacetyl-CoA epoxidase subunit PaaC [Ideonella sp. A 288]|uniref:1,2-phenylacetyl-CoA epoxidase subunit PaaC n=1 Tax=Ideonella sp. A 288 TaxID=1962181 RepID=UPI001F468062|nr:1,2-phenylacetyl-CoA epoxidase subunit PaaC [Ideonella sp. A 288]
MTASIATRHDPATQYVLRLGDACLILGQRLGEWCGHAPILEEDIALTNMALDLIGQSRALLTLAGQMNVRAGGDPLDEDQLAFLREERDYVNPTLVELPRGDFAFTVLRNAMVATWLELTWRHLATSTEPELAAIAGKAVKEARYHREHASDWVQRLGGGTDESARRLRDALDALWRYTPELFTDDAVDEAAAASGLGPRASALREAWQAEMTALLDDAGLQPPAATAFVSRGRQGQHTEHMGHLLTQLQYLQRAYPGGAW